MCGLRGPEHHRTRFRHTHQQAHCLHYQFREMAQLPNRIGSSKRYICKQKWRAFLPNANIGDTYMMVVNNFQLIIWYSKWCILSKSGERFNQTQTSETPIWRQLIISNWWIDILSIYSRFFQIADTFPDTVTFGFVYFCYSLFWTSPVLTHPPWTKRSPFCRWYFQMQFREWKVLYFD